MYPTTFVMGSNVAAWEKATSVSEAGRGLEATSAGNVRLWTSLSACKESCHKSSTNLQSNMKLCSVDMKEKCKHHPIQ